MLSEREVIKVISALEELASVRLGTVGVKQEMAWPTGLTKEKPSRRSQQGRVMLQNGRQTNLGAEWIQLY